MTSQTVVATANVLRSLRADDARAALRGVLLLEPDMVGLQEWELPRWGLLAETGRVVLVPRIGLRSRYRARKGLLSYTWAMPVMGGCAVGARADRYELMSVSSKFVSGIGRAEKPDRPLGLEPPRLVTLAVFFDMELGVRVCLVSYHLAPGVQSRGLYREDRPKLIGRHQREVDKLTKLVHGQLALGRDVYAVGDSNFHGLRLAGLTSAWEGREDGPGTHGSRKIDDVHGPGPATDITLITSASDHKALVATRGDA